MTWVLCLSLYINLKYDIDSATFIVCGCYCMDIKFPLKESLRLVRLLALFIIIINVLPGIVGQLFFLGLLYFMIKSKKMYFWYAFMIIISSNHGGFFTGGEEVVKTKLPLFTFAGGVSLGIFDLFFIMTFLKAINKRKKLICTYYRPFLLLLFYLLLLIFFSFYWGMDGLTIIRMLRVILAGTLFYSIYILFTDYDSFLKFIYLLYIPLAIGIVFQLFHLFAGSSISDYMFGGVAASVQGEGTKGWRL